MRKDFKKEWITALLSGDYVQGKTKLKTNTGKYCCLGVVCDLLVKKGILVERLDLLNIVFSCAKDKYDYSYQTLPNAAKKYLNLLSCDPTVTYKNEYKSLSDFNDRGKTFEEIAAIIEQTL